ncbi:methyl-accepting chemotaxis protein [Clostridium zeae]|uniref:Methyl-accepting chemotaxis protein n=1 Tax=Clostridium zeae TaxID=2759022 RepID=A0ABQ1EE06_9CLOT|nr:methyl-accepting chemotaxis protein [Clostridium zeae]GFZ33017.1 methyl-accepting chemotaxis protein [Clostridium zeae]
MKNINSKKINFSSLRVRLLIILLLVSIIPVMLLGFISYNKTFKILSDKFQITTEQNLQQVNHGIDNYFIGKKNVLNMLANNYYIQQLSSNQEFEQAAINLLKNGKEGDSDIKLFYFATPSKMMYLYPETKLPDGYDPTSRPWYQKAIQNKDTAVFSDPYQDSATGQFIISVSKAVELNGQVVGVVSADISLQTIAEQLSSIKIGKNGYVSITDGNGIMIANPDKSLIGTDSITKLEVWNKVKSEKQGFTQYSYKEQNKYASFCTNISTNWKLISSLDESELLNDANIIKNLTLIVIIAIALVAVGISLFVSKSILRHLIKLKTLFKKVSEGDLSAKAEVLTKDEFGDLGSCFNNMVESVCELIKNIKESAYIIANTSETINNMSNDTANAVNDVSVAMDQIAQGTTSQAQDISEGTEKINEIAVQIENISQLTDDMDAISVETNLLSENGLKVMELLTSKTKEANNSTHEASKVINDMKNSTDKISVITDTINSVAEQTNLLALNAAIEAARAGDTGRGFSVVADEIRKLAEQSTMATGEIQKLIEDIKDKSKDAVKSMNSAKKVVDEQSGAVNDTKEIFEQILDSIKNLMKEIKDIQISIRETTNNKDEIVGKMYNISAFAEENSASTEEVSASAEEVTAVMTEFNNSANRLKELAIKLESEINKFKI